MISESLLKPANDALVAQSCQRDAFCQIFLSVELAGFSWFGECNCCFSGGMTVYVAIFHGM